MTDSALLQRIPLFEALGSDARDYLLARTSVRTAEPLETLFWVGDSGNEMFVIESGQIEICITDAAGREIRLAVLGPGDFFGEISLLDGGPRTATARAIETTCLIVFSRQEFQRCMNDFPSVAVGVANSLSRRQRNTVEKLRGIRNLNEAIDERLTHWQKVANTVASQAATPGFLLTHAVGCAAWIIVNIVIGKDRAVDPFPFPFLCFWASVEAIFLSLFILISQAQQGQKERVRNEVEYQVALKLQLEMMQLHQKLDQQAELINRRIAADALPDDEL